MEKEDKTLMLRSENVRNIVGQIPSFLIRKGLAIIGVVLVILVAVLAIIPYRKTIPVVVTLHSVPDVEGVYAQHHGVFVVDSLACTPIKVEAGQRIGSVYCGDSVVNTPLVYGICSIDRSLASDIHKGQKVIIRLSDSREVTFIVSSVLEDDRKYKKLYLLLHDSYKLDVVMCGQCYVGAIMQKERSVLTWMMKGR